MTTLLDTTLTPIGTAAKSNGTAAAGSPSVDSRSRREFTGIVLRIRFYDAVTSTGIATARATGADAAYFGEVSIKGEWAEGDVEEGVAYRFFGKWTNHAKYGPQFHFDTHTNDAPSTRRGVLQYLIREAPGIGRATAEKLWAKYGESTLDTLRNDPHRVVDDGVMGPDAFDASAHLLSVAANEKTKIDLFELFSGRGFTKRTISACIAKWGVKAASKVRRDPYQMLVNEIPGEGWVRCDKLYLELGGRPELLKRQMLAAWNALRETDGDTWVIEGAARAAVVKACGFKQARFARAIELGLRARWLSQRVDAAGVKWLAEWQKAENETRLAAHIKRLAASTPVLWPSLETIAFNADGEMIISEHQYAGLASILTSPVAVLAGTPGTGKTYTAAAVLRAIVQQYGASSIAVHAPTGKAAVRITEAMQRYQLPLEATTTHRLLEIGRNGHDGKGWGFVRNESNPLRQKFLVGDEESMRDTDLAADTLAACANGTHVLLIGDPFQLSPVGHGAPLRDIIAANTVPHVVLSEIKRNAGLIVSACKSIKDGKPVVTCEKFDLTNGDNLRLIECDTSSDPAAQTDVTCRILEGIRNSKQHDPVWDVQVLVARNDERTRLNTVLQDLLNPRVVGEAAATDGVGNADGKAAKFRVGDKMICLRNCVAPLQAIRGPAPTWGPADEFSGEPAGGSHNDPRRLDSYADVRDVCGPTMAYLANGDMGRVESVGVGVLIVRFLTPVRLCKILIGKPKEADPQGPAAQSSGDAGDFDLAYAITCHKSQGSEFPIVIVLIDEGGGFVTCREWYNTAVSRAAKACFLVGRNATMAKQIKRSNLQKRKTFLAELLKGGVP